MQPLTATDTSAFHRTHSSSYIIGPEPPLWAFAFPQASFVVRQPPSRRKPRSRRPPAWRARAAVYSATLAADDYLEEARHALRDGDDDAVRHALAVLRAIVEVAIGKLRGASAEHAVLQ